MTMLAQYQIVNDEQLQQLKDCTDAQRFDQLECITDDTDEQDLVDLGKLWDVLHFCLTKTSATTPIENDLLSEFVVGSEAFSEDEDADFIAYIEWFMLAEIVEKIEQIDFANLLAEMQMKTLREKNLYPLGIWNDKKKNLDKELQSSFNELKNLYQKALDSGQHIVMSIC